MTPPVPAGGAAVGLAQTFGIMALVAAMIYFIVRLERNIGSAVKLLEKVMREQAEFGQRLAALEAERLDALERRAKAQENGRAPPPGSA